MKKHLFLTFALLIATTVIKADEVEQAVLTPDGVGMILSNSEELSNEIYVSLDYEHNEDGLTKYYVRLKFKEANVMVSTGRKLLIKLKDGSIITLKANGFEDKSTKGMYAIRWVGWKDNYHETTNLDLNVVYPIETEDLKKMLEIGAVKIRIDTDSRIFKWGNGRDDRFSWILNHGYTAIQKIVNRNPEEELYKDF